MATYLEHPISVLVSAEGQVPTPGRARMPLGPRVAQIMENPYPSNTIDSAGNDTDVNVIMARFDRTGILPEPTQQPNYADVVDLQGDLTEIHQRSQEALEIARKFAETWKPREEPPELPPEVIPTPVPPAA